MSVSNTTPISLQWQSNDEVAFVNKSNSGNNSYNALKIKATDYDAILTMNTSAMSAQNLLRIGRQIANVSGTETHTATFDFANDNIENIHFSQIHTASSDTLTFAIKDSATNLIRAEKRSGIDTLFIVGDSHNESVADSGIFTLKTDNSRVTSMRFSIPSLAAGDTVPRDILDITATKSSSGSEGVSTDMKLYSMYRSGAQSYTSSSFFEMLSNQADTTMTVFSAGSTHVKKLELAATGSTNTFSLYHASTSGQAALQFANSSTANILKLARVSDGNDAIELKTTYESSATVNSLRIKAADSANSVAFSFESSSASVQSLMYYPTDTASGTRSECFGTNISSSGAFTSRIYTNGSNTEILKTEGHGASATTYDVKSTYASKINTNYNIIGSLEISGHEGLKLPYKLASGTYAIPDASTAAGAVIPVTQSTSIAAFDDDALSRPFSSGAAHESDREAVLKRTIPSTWAVLQAIAEFEDIAPFKFVIDATNKVLTIRLPATANSGTEVNFNLDFTAHSATYEYHTVQ